MSCKGMVINIYTLVNVNVPVVATTSWWLLQRAGGCIFSTGGGVKVKESIPVDFMIYL